MIVALIIAATLSSDSIGTFFTFPEWMPTEVASSNTPGSDPASGEGGWYVEETTNGVVLAETWDMYVDGVLTFNNENLHFDGGRWYVADSVVKAFRIDVPNAFEINNVLPYEEYGSEDDSELELDEEVIYFATMEDERTGTFSFWDKHVRFVRHHPTIQPIPTGLLVSRSPRLTTDVMAGVYSTFEAYCERQYFALQGQSNAWNVATYGPTSQKRFYFDPFTNGVEFAWEPCSHTSTNRTVKTRRLVEYDNICGLADYMTDTLCLYGFAAVGVIRPGWIEAQDNLSEFDDFRCWWSTTDTRIFSGTSIVPVFGWGAYPSSFDWSKCSQAFTCLSNDDVWKNGFGFAPYDSQPLYNMMNERLDFGNPYKTFTLYCADIVDKTMRNMIETNYPHADGWAITNDTRRLFSDRLCCMNQVLGLMDRTYHEPEVIYPTTGTNTTYYNDLTCRGVTSGRATFSSGKYVISDFSPVAWESDVTTNRNSGISVGSSGSAYHHRVSKTTTSADAEFACADDFESQLTPDHGIASQLVAEAIASGFSISDGDRLFIQLDSPRTKDAGVWIQTHVRNTETGINYDSGMLFEIEITNVNVNVYYSYGRRYDYAKTIGGLSLGPSQPGYQAGSRFKAGKFGRVLGQHKKSGNVSTTLDVMPWSTSSSGSEYCSDESPFGSRSSLVNQMQSSISSAYNRFVYWYGLAPTDWQRIIPINATDAENVKRSITITSTELTFAPHCMCSTFGVYVDGVYQAYYYESYSYDGSEFYDDWTSLARAELGPVTKTMDSPSQTEEDGLATDTKVGVMTRVDWSWKTLKRTED